MSDNDNHSDLRHVVSRLHEALDELTALCESLKGEHGEDLAAEANTLRAMSTSMCCGQDLDHDDCLSSVPLLDVCHLGLADINADPRCRDG